ncbi:MAG: HAMP domain-containing histidine kinase [Anaerolineae bacterium]|nr:HAMP domain-containing histidine kinase [Anaerolineae bacterium]
MTLRWRLVVSYLLVLAVTLSAIALAIIFILRTRAAPPEPTYIRLASVAQSVDLTELVRDTIPLLNPDAQFDALAEELQSIADEREIRVMLIDTTRKVVSFDSAKAFSSGQEIDIQASLYSLPTQLQRGIFTRVDVLSGRFTDVNSEPWLFVALQQVRRGLTTNALVFADRQGQQSLQDALEDFGAGLLPLLCQAAAAGIIIAVILAGIISRTIARPLQGVAQAAAGVAAGNFAERVPVTGPPEVRSVAEAFNNMSTQVQLTQKAQQDFLANVSHDLKTPLTSIQGYSQAIVDGAAADPVSAARIIYEEAGRLNRMVVELTDLARLQAGRLSMHWSPVDIGQLTGAIAERLAIMAKEKNIVFNVETRPLPEVTGDGDRLAQVLTNLISNAIKYTPPGGHVWVKTGLYENGVQVIVKDDGIGISPAELARVFERFYQVDKARGPQRGTGLGLAIVSEIVQAHGGTIDVQSDGENKGATFTLWLPSPQMSTILRKR